MLGMRSIILWGRNNDGWAFQRPQKIHGIQPMYRLYRIGCARSTNTV